MIENRKRPTNIDGGHDFRFKNNVSYNHCFACEVHISEYENGTAPECKYPWIVVEGPKVEEPEVITKWNSWNLDAMNPTSRALYEQVQKNPRDLTLQNMLSDSLEEAGQCLNWRDGVEHAVGLKVSAVAQDSDTVTLTFDGGLKGRFYHDQDCCESVTIDSVDGSLESLIGGTVIEIIEDVGDEYQPHPEPKPETSEEIDEESYSDDSHTWTRYTIKTDKATVVMYWFGTSNGYYSESVNFQFLEFSNDVQSG